MAKRAYGSGSKREVRPGVWQLRAGGRSTTFRGTGKEAEAELARLVVIADSPRRLAAVPTLTELLAQWQSVANLEQSTRENYRYVLAHLPTELGRKRVDKLVLRDFDKLYADLVRKGVGVPTIRRLHRIVSTALTQAMRWDMIDHNPVSAAQPPRLAAKTPRVLTATELAAVQAEASKSLDGEVFFRLAIATGGRRGELCAIRWSDVDLDEATLSISKSLRADRSVKGTKTERARVVPLDAGTVDVLRRWRKAQLERAMTVGSGVVPDGYVLSHAPDCSQPWKPLAATRRWVRIAERAGAANVSLHGLRHTHVSMLIRAGVDVATVSQRAGHSRVGTTLNMYTHVLDDGRHAADVIGALLDQAQRGAR